MTNTDLLRELRKLIWYAEHGIVSRSVIENAKRVVKDTEKKIKQLTTEKANHE